MTRILVFCSYLLFSTQLLLAGITGAIAGSVKSADTGEAMIGANVYLVGTTLGSASDSYGYYVILNVPPGTYTLEVSMVGYERLQVTNVEVAIDLTTRINVDMRSEVMGMGEVTVVAERPVVIPDMSNSLANIRAETIERLPVVSLTQVVGLQAGIEGLTIRGSSSYQSAFLVDGLSLNDERANRPFTAVSLSSVQEVQVQTGGFNAEYGYARSGIISVVTREGDRDLYTGMATYRYSPPTPKHFGPSIFSDHTYFTRPYMDPEVAWTGTDTGVWDVYEQRQYPRFGGFNAISEALLQDDNPGNDLSPSSVQRLYMWEHRRQGDIVIPDYTIDVGLGGPVPFLSRYLGNLRFFASYREEQEAFIFPLSRDHYFENMAQLKLTSDMGSSTKLTQWTTPPSGTYMRGEDDVARRVTGSRANSVVYQPGYYNPISIFRSIWGARLSHVLSDRAYFDVLVQWKRNKYHANQTTTRDTSRKYEIVPGYYDNEAPYGYWSSTDDSFTDGMSMGAWMGFAQDRSLNSTLLVKADLTSQVRPTHQMKTGFELTYNDYSIHSANVNPNWSSWTYRLDWDRYPYRFGTYVQDKIEIRQFVANVGLRLDYSNPNGDWYDLEAYDKLLTSAYGVSVEELAPSVKAKDRWYLSPRLGVSHPITVNSKLYFNYGHFQQLLQADYLFKVDRRGSGSVLRLGNPSLLQSRTVAYELGYEQNLFNQMLFKLAAYYKDITEQPSWTRYLSADNQVDYYRAGTDNYEDIRGLEVTLEKRIGRILTGFINYTYMVSTEGYFGMENYYEDPKRQREYLLDNPYQEKPHPRPYLRANINLHSPESFGPRMFGLQPLGGWNVNLLATWKAGNYFTFNPGNLPGIEDNMQWRDYTNFDLRLSKTMTSGRNNVQFFVDINNVFNIKNFSERGFSDSHDREYYMNSLHLSEDEGAEHGDDRPGDYRKPGVAFVPIETIDYPTELGDPATRPIYYSRYGETFEDGNDNGVRDTGEVFEDINGNGAYDGSETYWQYGEGQWDLADPDYLQEVLDDKAYIDMPNYEYFTFLNPRDITIGIKISF
jgi:outer membrane receptor protein involved in Fe transport